MKRDRIDRNVARVSARVRVLPRVPRVALRWLDAMLVLRGAFVDDMEGVIAGYRSSNVDAVTAEPVDGRRGTSYSEDDSEYRPRSSVLTTVSSLGN